MKFYTYKNGEIAFFENNEKMLISKEEKEMLVSGYDPMDGSAIYSIVQYYISDKIGDKKLSKVLEEYRNNTYTKESQQVSVNGKDIEVRLYRENGSIIATELCFMGEVKRVTWNGRSGFDKVVAQLESLGIK